MFGKSKLSDSDKNRSPKSETPTWTPAQAVVSSSGTEIAPKLGVLQAPAVKPSVISDAVNFVGEFRSTGALHIDGVAKGTIEAESVTVGTGGSLEGVVTCRKFQIKGRFSGEAVCEDLIVSNEATVSGSLKYHTIIVQRGARVIGNCFVGETQ